MIGSALRSDTPPSALVSFPEITFSKPGVYEYVIKEYPADIPGWTVDNSAYRVVVTVVEEGGELRNYIDYPDGEPRFINRYAGYDDDIDEPEKTDSVKVELRAMKTVKRGTLENVAGAFSFGLYTQKRELIHIAANRADGSIVFPVLTFHRAGTYNYYMREIRRLFNDGWENYGNVYRITITVTERWGRMEADIKPSNVIWF